MLIVYDLFRILNFFNLNLRNIHLNLSSKFLSTFKYIITLNLLFKNFDCLF